MEPSPKRFKTGDDSEYFKSYGDLRVHEEMIDDTVRTFGYRQAILRNYELIRGKVVLDVGAGTGILSVFCVHAGAKKVYAVEASDMAVITNEVVRENEMTDKIQVFQSRIEEVELPEKVDVIVSEWMDGVLFPGEASIYLAPFTEPRDLNDRPHFWDDIENRYKVKMTCISNIVRQRLFSKIQIQGMNGEDLIAHACKICCLNLKTVTLEDLNNVKGNFAFKCFGHQKMHGFVAWFTVSFPDGTAITTSPFHELTHWQHSVMYVEDTPMTDQDTIINGTISLRPGKTYNRFLDVLLTYALDGGLEISREYVMDDGTS